MISGPSVISWVGSHAEQIEKAACAAYGYCINGTQQNILKNFGEFLGEVEIINYASITTMISSQIWDEWAINTELSVSGAMGLRGGAARGLIVDSKGNIAISGSFSIGAGSPTLGASLNQTIVRDIDYANYAGWGGNIGGSLGLGPTPFTVGGDFVTMAEGDNEKNGHMGMGGNAGLGVAIPGFTYEFHGEANYTYIVGQVNIYTGDFDIGIENGYEGNIYEGRIERKEHVGN